MSKNLVGERISKVIARSGYCSRRDAEKLIATGVVKVNGAILHTPVMGITDQTIKINNKLIIPQPETKLWIFHKPRGYLVTQKDPERRNTIYDLLPKNFPRVVTIGRLDMDTEGLLLLTNNGQLARYMEHPVNGWIRRYRVKVNGSTLKLEKALVFMAEKGLQIEKIKYAPLKISLEKESKTTNTWWQVALQEGKNHEVRNIFEYFGLRILRLQRISFGPFQLGSCSKGNLCQVSAKVLKGVIGKEQP
jgi:23S rRNA pseudouridine2605 synthase